MRLNRPICARCQARILLVCKQVLYQGEVPATASGTASAN